MKALVKVIGIAAVLGLFSVYLSATEEASEKVATQAQQVDEFGMDLVQFDFMQKQIEEAQAKVVELRAATEAATENALAKKRYEQQVDIRNALIKSYYDAKMALLIEHFDSPAPSQP